MKIRAFLLSILMATMLMPLSFADTPAVTASPSAKIPEAEIEANTNLKSFVVNVMTFVYHFYKTVNMFNQKFLESTNISPSTAEQISEIPTLFCSFLTSGFQEKEATSLDTTNIQAALGFDFGHNFTTPARYDLSPTPRTQDFKLSSRPPMIERALALLSAYEFETNEKGEYKTIYGARYKLFNSFTYAEIFKALQQLAQDYRAYLAKQNNHDSQNVTPDLFSRPCTEQKATAGSMVKADNAPENSVVDRPLTASTPPALAPEVPSTPRANLNAAPAPKTGSLAPSFTFQPATPETDVAPPTKSSGGTGSLKKVDG